VNTFFLTLNTIALVVRMNYVDEHFVLTEHYHYLFFYMIYNEVNLFGSL